MAHIAAKRIAILTVAVALVAAALVAVMGTAHASAQPISSLRVQGNQVLDASNNVVQLRGVNRSGTEYACIQGWGIFDGPSDDASVAAIASWGANVVRVPLNEDCWLGINGVDPAYSGQNYISAVVNYVNLLHAHNMYAELSLIWAAPGTYQATYQSGAPDEDHSPAFWSSLASTFKSDPEVVLAPWGETETGWQCFMVTGCNDQATYGPQNQGYQTAPMAQAVSVMRQAGYTGIIAVPCIAYANNCDSDAPEWSGWGGNGSWLTYEPNDPLHNLIAEAHVYGKNLCDTAQCLTDAMGPVAAQVPMIFGETGETYDGTDCNNSSANTSTFMNWADAHGVGYEAWTWDTWGACQLSLITDFNGTPYGTYGTYVKNHLLSLAGGSVSTPTPTPTVAPTNTPTNTPTPTPTVTGTPTPTPSPTPAPSFSAGGVYNAYVAIKGNSNGATETFVLEVYNGTTKIASTSKAQTLNGTLILSKQVSLIGIAPGTALRVRVYVKDASGHVLNDWPNFASYTV